MYTFSTALDLRPPNERGIGTGLSELDDLTGGLQFGQLWVIMADAGHGSSSLLAQWAARTALAYKVKVKVLSPRDEARICAVRMLASCTRVPVQHALRDQLEKAHLERIGDLRANLEQADIEIADRWSAESALERCLADPRTPVAMFIDDAYMIESAIERVVAVARRGGLVVLAMPRHHTTRLEYSEPAAVPAWWKLADVAIDVTSCGVNPSAEARRPGESDIRVLRNRNGGLGSLTVAFQGHYARFVEMMA